jgi:hypothetical protein
MASSFTNLIPSLYAGLDVVSRELVGYIPAVNKDGKGAERAAVNQTVYFPLAPALEAETPVPAATGPDPDDIDMGSDSLTISKDRGVPFFLTGEEIRAAETGSGVSVYLRDLVAQALRTLVAEIETDLAALHKHASRAYKVASGNTFDATDGIKSIAQIRKILTKNGAPMGDLHLVLDPDFAAALRTQGLLVKANEAGSTDMLRQGTLGRILGFDIHESVGAVASGSTAAAAYAVNTAGAAIGAVSVPIKTGTDPIGAGDIVKFEDDPALYVVNTALTGAGNLLINKPGLRIAVVSNDTLTFQGVYTPLSAFSRNALTLITRQPALPKDGDAGEHTVLQDPVSGLAFDVARYKQYRREAWQIGICWGVKCTKQEHYALIMGV